MPDLAFFLPELLSTFSLKQEIVSPQQKWNKKNPEKLRESDRTYKAANPPYNFFPDPELRKQIEAARLSGESGLGKAECEATRATFSLVFLGIE